MSSWSKTTSKSFVTKGAVELGQLLVTKLFETVLLHEDITQLEQKNSSPWYTCDLSLHQVSAMYVHYFWKYEHFSERHFHFLALKFCGNVIITILVALFCWGIKATRKLRTSISWLMYGRCTFRAARGIGNFIAKTRNWQFNYCTQMLVHFQGRTRDWQFYWWNEEMKVNYFNQMILCSYE